MMGEANSVTGLEVRVATEQDGPGLVALVNSAFAIESFLEGTRTDDAGLIRMMEKGKILVALDGTGRLVGCVYTEIRGERGYLGMLAIDPQRQGTGLARPLVGAAEEQFRRMGCETVDITVLSLRAELLPIYRRFGFQETGTEEMGPTRSLKPGVECHCIVMSKQL